MIDLTMPPATHYAESMSEAASPRPRRADATRNNDRLIAAARLCFRIEGHEVSLQTIANQAGVGVATLFRNFADKDEMILAVLADEITSRVNPLVARALADPDPVRGMMYIINGVMGIASREANMMAAVAVRREILIGIATPMVGSLYELLKRAQSQNRIRAEIGAGDLVILLAMILSAVESSPPGSRSWRRYAALLGDAVLQPGKHRTLPPAHELIWLPNFG